MKNLSQWVAELMAMENIVDAVLDEVVVDSDIDNHARFFPASAEETHNEVKKLSEMFVEKYLNNANTDVVPIRRKTRFLLVLNNFSLHKPTREAILGAIANMTGVFEDAMKREGTMPFDSELGRMSEHVLVLLMRTMNNKIKAAQVLEFADGNTQFAVQLLLAILLKEPPYEFELRCNCLTGLLGFTQPQAFFTPGSNIDFNDCSSFSDKIDFICNLILRLAALQVVNDVVSPQLLDYPTVQPLVHVAVMSTMRCVMNIFQFATTGATQFRQHVLMSTTFVDGVAILYLQAQIRALESALLVAPHLPSPSVPADVIPGLALAMKFMGFATFHMGRHGRGLRPLCAFIYDLLTLPGLSKLFSPTNPQQQSGTVRLFASMLHFLCNMDALDGEENMPEADELIPEMTSTALTGSISTFVNYELAQAGMDVVDMLHKKFYSVDTDALVSQESATFAIIDNIFTDAKQKSPSKQAPPPPAPSAAEKTDAQKRFLGDMPNLQKSHAAQKQSIEMAAAPVAMVPSTYSAPKRTQQPAHDYSAPSKYACALNGHTMKTPVISPYGHTFEKDTIMKWLASQGSVCPLTGKPLSAEDLKPNTELQNEIMQALIQESMSMTNFNAEEEGDLYDF